MSTFNQAYQRVLASGLTLGLMTPYPTPQARPANWDGAKRIAKLAESAGFKALWARDVPLMIPQMGSVSALDDPFIWLAMLSAATTSIAIGTAAAVLPLREPLHLAKTALSLDRLTSGRFILGLGSGDRPEEFAAFGSELAQASSQYQKNWAIVRAALAPADGEHGALMASTGGYGVLPPDAGRIPMVVVGTARQSLQWIASNADGWASYHREEGRQQGRIGLWAQALSERNGGVQKPFIQSLNLDLVVDESAPSEPIFLGMRTGRLALIEYLRHLHEFGVAHVIVNLIPGSRSVDEVLLELGQHVIPTLVGVGLKADI